jgi:hypothetical protein
MPRWPSRWAAATGQTRSGFSDASSGRHSVFDCRILLNGGVDDVIHEREEFAGDLSFAVLKPDVFINEHACAADKKADTAPCLRQADPAIAP